MTIPPEQPQEANLEAIREQEVNMLVPQYGFSDPDIADFEHQVMQDAIRKAMERRQRQ